MKKPVPVALLTFLPVLFLALLRPDWITGIALTLVLLADVSFFRDVSYKLRDLAREGPVPYRVRYPFFAFLAGLLGYGAISIHYVSPNMVPVVAIGAAAAIAASKFWISAGPLWPYTRKAATS